MSVGDEKLPNMTSESQIEVSPSPRLHYWNLCVLCKTDPVKHLCVLAGSALSPAHVWHDWECAGANRGAHWGEREPVRVKSKLWPLGVPLGPSQQVQRIVRTIGVCIHFYNVSKMWLFFPAGLFCHLHWKLLLNHDLNTNVKQSLLAHKSNVNLPAVKRLF